MKNLKVIIIMLLAANFSFAQTNSYFAPDQGQTGDRNTFIGAKTGLDAEIGDGNTFVGHQAGMDAKGRRNVYIGENAGSEATGTASYATAIGFASGMKNQAGYNVFIGAYTGQNNTTGGNNVFIGRDAGRLNVSGRENMFLGTYAGQNNMANGNTFVGAFSGRYTTTGKSNMFLGTNSGLNNVDGDFNLFSGNNAGQANESGNKNVYLGANAGYLNTGGNNVFIGYEAGKELTGVSNKLYIQNSKELETPLIYGDFAGSQVGIGTSDVPANYRLAVKGHIVAEELTLSVYQDGASGSGWPDYVFEEDYDLTPLNELEVQIETLGHLPGVPSAQEVGQNGHKAGQMDAILLEKVEELTLHLIEMDKTIKRLEKIEQELRTENEALRK